MGASVIDVNILRSRLLGVSLLLSVKDKTNGASHSDNTCDEGALLVDDRAYGLTEAVTVDVSSDVFSLSIVSSSSVVAPRCGVILFIAGRFIDTMLIGRSG